MAITVLGKTFESEEERREYFREELGKKLPELKKMEGFPIGEDEDIIELSDPPYYTACPNPWLNSFINEWENEKKDDQNRKIEFNVTEPYANDVSVGKNNSIYRAHSYHTKVPHPAIMRYVMHYTQPGDLIFDGFAGTGMTGVAAQKCGDPKTKVKSSIEEEFKNRDKKISWGRRNSVCGDLSPLASFIAFNLNTNKKKEHLDNFDNVISSLEKKYDWAFSTNHKNLGRGTINYTVWSDYIKCSECNYEMEFWEAFVEMGEGNIKNRIQCENCDAEIKRRGCDYAFETYYDHVLEEPIKRKTRKPVLINYFFDGKRYNKKPDESDLKVLDRIENEIKNKSIPTSRMPAGDESRRNDKFGITHTHQFYTSRTVLVLTELFEKLVLENKWLVTNSLSRNLTLMNRFVVNKHNPNGRINGPMSGTLYVPSESVEQNPFVLLDYKSNVPTYTQNNARVGSTAIYVGSATDLNYIKDESFDYIFTDPPFGANIMYSELNFISESFLKVYTNNDKEAIENKSQSKGQLEYKNLMRDCFQEYYKKLKPGKWMTVEFSNTSAAIWNSIQTAITESGFVIANVASIDKKHGGFRAMAYPGSVKQDLVISCYKPTSEFDTLFKERKGKEVAIWDFVEEHLNHLPIHLIKGNSTTAIIERSPKILYDRLISFYVQHGLQVPIDAGKFQKGLRERFIERDGMFFTNEQVQEYDRKKAEVPNFTQLSILVASEQDGVLWLQNFLKNDSKTYQDIQPEWMQALGGERKGDIIPELKTILEENFLKNDAGEWYVPDPDKEEDLEKLRNRRLLKQFEDYKEQAFKPKGKIKECRVEALRAGFKQSYQDKDFETIVRVGDRIPENLLMEDEVLLQFYDIAAAKV